MARIPEFAFNQLQRICDVLAETSTGLTGSEIGRYLNRLWTYIILNTRNPVIKILLPGNYYEYQYKRFSGWLFIVCLG